MTHSDSNTDSHTHTDTPACDALTARYRHMTHTAAAGRRDTHRAPHVTHSAVIQPTRVVVALSTD